MKQTILIFFIFSFAFATYAQLRPPKCAVFNEMKKDNHLLSNVKPRPILPNSIKTPKGFATVHYTLIGVNAVPNKDANNNQIPDYIESVCESIDYSFKIIVDSLGYPPPISDTFGPDSTVDIYMLDLFPLYGATYPDVSTNPNVTISPSFIEIDNDFENAGYYTKGINGAKVTIAHELHHVIQYAHYGVTNYNTRKIYEMYSTYIEQIVYPEIPDYISYINDLFNNLELYPFGDGNPSSGYQWSIFAIMISEKYGDVVFKKMWNTIKNGLLPYQALDAALNTVGSSISEEFRDFFFYSYYTNYRSFLPSNSKFKNAAQFPLLKPYSGADSVFTAPSYLSVNTLKPFEVRMFKVLLPKINVEFRPDTFTIVTSNFDVKSMYEGTNIAQEYTLLIRKGPINLIPIKNLDYTFSLDLPHEYYLESALETQEISYSYPMPFLKSVHTELFIPLPKNYSNNSKVEISILTTEGILIRGYTKEVFFLADTKHIKLSNQELDSLSKGIYIAIVQQGENHFLSKISIK